MFIAKKDFQCGICGLLIPKGSTDFRFLRKAGNEWVAIHATCKGKESTKAKLEYPKKLDWNPEPYDDSLKEQVLKAEAPKTVKEALKKAPEKEVPEFKVPDPKREEKDSRGESIEAAIKKLIEKTATRAEMDENRVREICKEEIVQVTLPRTLEFKINDLPAVNVKLAHKALEALVKLVSIRNNAGHRFNVYLHGPAGSGKSSGARQVKDILNAERYGYISLNPQTPDSRLLGFIHAGGQYVESEFYRCYVNGGVFCIDEIDNASASLLTTLNGLLENGHAAFPHGVYPRHADFVCIATANTIGRGGDIQYPERRALDGATLERFVFLEWGYDEAMTRAIMSDIVGDKADDIIKWVNETGRTLKSKYPTLIVSPRAYIHSAVLERNGFDRDTIKQMVIARGVK